MNRFELLKIPIVDIPPPRNDMDEKFPSFRGGSDEVPQRIELDLSNRRRMLRVPRSGKQIKK